MIRKRIETVREMMKIQKVDIYVVFTDDYHMSEYAGDYFAQRQFLSGFTGSAGTLVITAGEAALFTDGRYFVQAEKQLCGTGIKLMKSGCKGVPTLSQYCEEMLQDCGIIGFDGRCVSSDQGAALEKIALKKKGHINYNFNPVGKIWKDRPDFPMSSAYDLTVGQTRWEKIEELRKRVSEKNATAHIIAALDDICWLMNVRGSDVKCNPVIMSYLYITENEVVLYTDECRFDEEIKQEFNDNNVIIKPYESIYDDIAEIRNEKVLADKKRLNYNLYKLLEEGSDRGVQIIEAENPSVSMKAVKNSSEIKNLKEVHIDDGAAVTKFSFWLKQAVKSGKNITEADAASYLDKLRSNIKDYIDLSFDTISAYGENAAMMHYHAEDETAAILKPYGMLLVDSGGQYLRGTTDVTRTFALGEVTDEMKRHFTLTLKGMLSLASAKFLRGCSGYSLDILARAPLWNEGIDYRCGTGHGVGYLLNVHEAPNAFRWKYNSASAEWAVLEPGMVTSDEPGVYIDGKYGIRIENEILCVHDYENEYGEFLKFDMLTCVPIDLELVDKSLLDDNDRRRLNDYHEWVYNSLAGYMDDNELKLLTEATHKI